MPRFAVSEFSTINRGFDEDLAAYAAGGAEGVCARAVMDVCKTLTSASA